VVVRNGAPLCAFALRSLLRPTRCSYERGYEPSVARSDGAYSLATQLLHAVSPFPFALMCVYF
jgi:hypothetical protein